MAPQDLVDLRCVEGDHAEAEVRARVARREISFAIQRASAGLRLLCPPCSRPAEREGPPTRRRGRHTQAGRERSPRRDVGAESFAVRGVEGVADKGTQQHGMHSGYWTSRVTTCADAVAGFASTHRLKELARTSCGGGPSRWHRKRSARAGFDVGLEDVRQLPMVADQNDAALC